jgi:5-methyltetrahydropteroyltriglutamate--homocysteine methyltransferase
VVDGFYGDDAAAVMAFAAALNHELRCLDEAGADVLQIDEPAFHSRLSLATIVERLEGLCRVSRRTSC